MMTAHAVQLREQFHNTSFELCACDIPSDYGILPCQVENSDPRRDVARFSPRSGPILCVPETMQPEVCTCLEKSHESDGGLKRTCKIERHHRFSTPKRVPHWDVARFSPRSGPILRVPETMQPGVCTCLEKSHGGDGGL